MAQEKSYPDIVQQDSIDVRALFYKFSKYWYLFVISVVVFMLGGYFFTRLAEPIYKVSTTVLVKNDDGGGNFFEQWAWFKPGKNIQNEIGVLTSWDLAYNTLTKLDFEVTYLRKGRIRWRDSYQSAPFDVVFDSSHVQPVYLTFIVTLLNNKEYELELLKESSGALYNYLTGESSGLFECSEGFKKKYAFGEQISTENYSFFIHLNERYTAGRSEERDYQFYFNTYQGLANEFSHVEVEQLNRESGILNISLKHESASKALTYVNMLSKSYLQRELDEKNLKHSNTVDFIDDQLSELSDTMQIVETNLKDFRTLNRITDVGQQSEIILQRFESLDNERALEQLRAKYYDYLLSYIQAQHLKGELISPSTMGIEDPQLNTLVGQLNTLSVEKARLELVSTPENPSLRAIDSRLESLRKALNENVRNIVLISKISQKELDRRLSEIQAEVGRLPETERQLLNIQRKFNVNDRIYTFLLEKRAEASISKASNTPSNSILDRARTAAMVYPQIRLNYTIAFLLGLLLPFLIIVIRDFFDDKIHSRADIESLTDVPILGIISHSAEKYNTIVISRPKSIIAETFRSLRTNLQFIAAEKDKRVFTVTSTLSGEGKTFTAINMASIFALSGKKTLLLSCDLRKPKLYDDFNLNNEKGMTTYLVGRCSVQEIVQSSGYEFLDIVTSGPVPPNPSELLESARMSEMMVEVRQQYDYIVIDSPPVGLVTDAVFLMKQSDANIYVVRQNYSSKHAMSTLNDLVRSTGLKNITIAVNDVDFTDRAYGRTGYGYGYGYGYGNEYGYYYGGEHEGTKKTKKRWKAFLGLS